MSIIIKGLDMPKEANHFEITFYSADEKQRETAIGFCKPNIIQIPKGHGRLIDESAIIKNFYHNISLKELMDSPLSAFQKCMDNAPTILEAEA